ncbi:TonB-dependent receptor [Flavobacteriaceae bacterium]|nr:TonB-dependent receptor [Flavobacteriaceae bacterium]MDB9873756.1 TonB-dependent receptor [Flavobacteriaceae bacterium]
MNRFLLSIFSFFILSTSAQQIVVVDESNNQSIVGVAVFNDLKTKTAITDFDGDVSLDAFNQFDKIYFQHLSYHKITILKSSIQDTVFLSPRATSLNEVVISASKFEQSKKEVPQNIISISSKDVQLSNPQTSADLLSNSGRVFVQKSQLGGGSPMIRGFSTNRLLITVDGVRLNNAIFRGGNVQNVLSINPFNVEKTEVILGSGSVIYGSDAIGGVMNFYTTTPKLSESTTPNLTARSTVRYASANNEKTAHLDFNLGFKKWGFHSSMSVSDFGDLKMGAHGSNDYLSYHYVESVNGQDIMVSNTSPRVQKFTKFRQMHLSQKVLYKANNDLKFDLGLHYSTTSDYPRYDRLSTYGSDGILHYAEWNYGPQDWFLANLQMTKLSSGSSLYDKIKLSAAYQNFKESRINRKFNSDTRKIQEENVDALSFNFDFYKSLSNSSTISYGTEYIYNRVGSSAYKINIDTNASDGIASRYPDGSKWQTLAAYLSHKYKPNSKLTVQSGIRYNYVTIDADLTDNNVFYNLPFRMADLDTSALTGTFGLSWNPNPIFLWKLNATTAFRAPNIDDIGKIFDPQDGLVVVPNGDLKPEYAYGGELGVTINFKESTVFDCSAYYTYLDNALVRKSFMVGGVTEMEYDGALSEIQAIQNASKSWIYGFEAGLNIRFSKALKSTTQFSYVHGIQEDTAGVELPVRHVAPIFGNAHLIWKYNKLKMDGFVNYNGALRGSDISVELADSLFALDAQGNPYAPSWYSLNLRSQYDFNKSISVVGAIENITNQRYRTFSSGISAPGTNLILAVTYKL